HAGGILGGISNGDPIVVRFAVKPTSSIITPRETVTTANENTEVITKGRHDPCVGIRAVPIGEAMMAVTLADHFLRHRGQTGRECGIGFCQKAKAPLAERLFPDVSRERQKRCGWA